MLKQAQIFKKMQENVNPSPERREERPTPANTPGTPQAVVKQLDADTQEIRVDITIPQQNTGPSQVNRQIILANIEPLLLKLQALICALKNIFRPLQDSAVKELRLAGSTLQVHVSEELTEERAALMLELIRGLKNLRDNGDERLVFLLGAEAQTLKEQLQKRVPEMEKCVKAVQDCAEELTPTCRSPCKSLCCASRMGVVLNWGTFSSLLGVLASLLSLCGLADISTPTSLLLSGAIVSGVSGLIRLVVILAEVWLNKSQKIKANAECEKFQGHVKVLRRSLNSAIYSLTDRIREEDQTFMGSKIGYKSLRVLLVIIDIVSDVYTRITAEEVPDIRLARGGPWIKAKFMYVLGIGTNSVVLVWDAYTFINNLCVLCKKKKPLTSQRLRARASLWEAEVET